MDRNKREIPRGSLPAHTARRIMRDFTDKGLKPGDGLADEATLVERYGVSRGTLREALRLLSFLGAVTVKPGPQGGPRLGLPGPAVVGSALGMVVQYQGATLATVFEALHAVEPSVAALAATCREDSDLALLDESVEALRATERKRGPEYTEHAVAYTLRVAEASHNAVLGTIVPALVAMNRTVPWRYPEGGRPEMTERVQAVVEAIRHRDSEGASRHTRRMIEWLIDSLRSHQPAYLERRILWPDLDEVLSSSPRD
ncbi:FadR/GntR family transcriptional regulator [Streptomyces sp. MMCC 100]|uniref:FadR/GntR family transcriptional regulator n=1 Tax=Streptomyces sp. MMCC 100 TaxID=3163555 RepID=UPI00359C05E2